MTRLSALAAACAACIVGGIRLGSVATRLEDEHGSARPAGTTDGERRSLPEGAQERIRRQAGGDVRPLTLRPSARFFVASPSPDFARTGRPGSLRGPWTRDVLGAAGHRPETAGLVWIVEGERLWRALRWRKGDRALEEVDVLRWVALEAQCPTTGSNVDAYLVLPDGTPLPAVNGRVPLVRPGLRVASAGYVPVPVVPSLACASRLQVTLARAVTVSGRLPNRPSPGARAFLDLPGMLGRVELELAADGELAGHCLPEGKARFFLEDRWQGVGFYGSGLGVELIPPHTELGTLVTHPKGDLVVRLVRQHDGRVWLQPWDHIRRPEPDERLTWPVVEGRREGNRRWVFHGVRGVATYGWIWTAGGWSATLGAPLALTRKGGLITHPIALRAPGTYEARLLGGAGARAVGFFATPRWVGPADPVWRKLGRGRPWLPLRAGGLAGAPAVVRVPRLMPGCWTIAMTREGRILDRRVVDVPGGGRVYGEPWEVPGVGYLRLLPPSCTRHRVAYRVLVRSSGAGVSHHLLAAGASEPVRVGPLPAGECRITIRATRGGGDARGFGSAPARTRRDLGRLDLRQLGFVRKKVIIRADREQTLRIECIRRASRD